MVAMFQPPFCPADEAVRRVQERGYAVLEPRAMADAVDAKLNALDALLSSWDRLEVDAYLKDGGRYRRRRHSCFVADADDLQQVPHRAHWQSLDYNALHGGMQRWFEPIEPAVVDDPAWRRLLMGLGRWCSVLKGERPWYVEAHQFRIDTTDGIGRPTPEGAHRDGVDFVAVLLLGRQGIKGAKPGCSPPPGRTASVSRWRRHGRYCSSTTSGSSTSPRRSSRWTGRATAIRWC